MIVGTAGHIDHGKTALVKALTGIDADRLPAEKARGITIDLGFAYRRLPDGEVLGFVDVPGHERFIHTMLAGAGGIDFALLVVAADDGPMPQTHEHLAILDLLGIRRGLVALTKADLADEPRRRALLTEIAAMLAPTGLAGAQVLPVSAVTGEGVPDLAARLAAAAPALKREAPHGRFRLAVDRSFTIAGAGTVVTGTVFAGSVRRGDPVIVTPGGLEARVRGIRANDRPAEQGVAGERCALNLAGQGVAKEAIRRGDWVTVAAGHAPTDRLDASLLLLPGEAGPLRHGTPVHLHLAAAHVPARLLLLEERPIPPGSRGLAQLALERAIGALHGDRFVLRDTCAQRTLGGGHVLDPFPPQRRRRAPERLVFLGALAEADPAAALLALVDLPPGLADLAAFARDRNLTAAELEEVAKACGVLRLASGDRAWAMAPAAWTGFRAQVTAALAAFHEKNPELAGMAQTQLRLALPARWPADAFPAMVQALAKLGAVAVAANRIRLPGHTVKLAPEDQRLWARIAPLLGGGARFRPPRVRDLAALLRAPEARVRRVLKLMTRLGETEEVAHDHFFLRPVVDEMVKIAAAIAAADPAGEVSAAAFRDRLGNGRKVAIQVLEFFDVHGLTLRKGDLRRLRRDRLDLFAGESG